MAMSFMQMAEEAMAQVEGISAKETQQRLEQDSNTHRLASTACTYHLFHFSNSKQGAASL